MQRQDEAPPALGVFTPSLHYRGQMGRDLSSSDVKCAVNEAFPETSGSTREKQLHAAAKCG